MEQINFLIDGIPAPQGSKRILRGRLVEVSSEKLKVWRKAIAETCIEAREGNNKFFTGPVAVTVAFYLPRPKSVKMTGKNARLLPTVPPDIDKLCRALLDGIGQSEMIWGDDSQVVELTAWKEYADFGREPGAYVTIQSLPDDDMLENDPRWS